MSHLNTAYLCGAHDAQIEFEKQARLGTYSKLWRSMAPESQAIMKQIGTGAGIGAVPGAIAGGTGEDGSLLGALGGATLGAAVGTAGGRGVGRYMQGKAQRQLGQRYKTLLEPALTGPMRPGEASSIRREFAQAYGSDLKNLSQQIRSTAFPRLRIPS